MTQTRTKADELLDVIDLETIDINLFRGQNEYREDGMRLFGGQVLAQAVTAAMRTVPGDHRVHSLHGYFLRPGDANVPVLYSVDRIRDGNSFTTRRVKAIQKGEAIFSMSASFHIDEAGFSHQTDMPDVPHPDDLEDDRFVVARIYKINDLTNNWATRERAFEMRSAYPMDKSRPDETNNPVWIRYRTDLPEDQNLHHSLLAYASDMGFVATAFIPHKVQAKRMQIQMASLDHAIWFHLPVNLNEWILYYKSTPSSSGSRGFNQGTFYTIDGKLIASTMQEGLMRLR